MLLKDFKKEDFLIKDVGGVKEELINNLDRWKTILSRSENEDLSTLKKIYNPLQSFKFEELYAILKKEKKINCSDVAFRGRLKKLDRWGILVYETNGVTQIFPVKDLKNQIIKILILRGKVIE